MTTMERIKEIICDYVDVDPDALGPDTSLRNDIGASSFDLMNVAVAIEEAYAISIPNSRMLTVKTVGDIVTLLESI